MDDLNTPLARPPAKRWRLRLPLTAPQVLAGACGLFLAAFAIWSVVVDDPLGGEPTATAPQEVAPAATPAAETNQTTPASTTPDQTTVTPAAAPAPAAPAAAPASKPLDEAATG